MITAADILSDLEAYTFRRVLAAGHPEKTALACSRALFDCLFLNFRKQYMYVPTTDKAAQKTRYEEIWNAFTGHNHAELSMRYRLSVPQIYSITKLMRANNIRQRQHDLFPLPDEEADKPLTLVVLEDYLPADLERAGLPLELAIQVASEVAIHLCATYPGISVRMTESLWQKRQQPGNDDLFGSDEAEAI
ncbi:Mor transcription activator family protein [Methylomonas sp. 11b]|uniref:Mor transcription activator family protein n=1 Tax=Methylomonas sp. 11b TaxID=1168169 RepID=UPI000479CCE2|nr:Mor transcription activator family protein [Methylomonas sp. 11b]